MADPAIAALRRIIGSATRLVAFTGAGISTESGIPDYRSPGGLWSRMQPITLAEFTGSRAARLEDWRRRFVMNEDFARAIPNAGHRALVELQARGTLEAVITQNIDGMHQKAGLPADRVVELHGNATYGACLDCAARMELAAIRAAIDAWGEAPRCAACGGLVKAAVISFGQALVPSVLDRAARLAQACDVMLVLGSSLVVEPAASLPRLAAGAGAALVIVNDEPTPLDPLATLRVRGSIGAALAAATA